MTVGHASVWESSLRASARPVNADCSKPPFIAACSFPAPSSPWLRKRRAPGWPKPAGWRPRRRLMRTIFTARWISSPATGRAWKSNSTSAPSPQAVRLVLYDLTSVYFEGNGPEHLARYGHSRDHRSDRPQIILAVATDTEGLPLHVSILRGNRNDTQTLQGLLQTLRRRFGITEATFVFDGGLSSRINLEAMTRSEEHTSEL